MNKKLIQRFSELEVQLDKIEETKKLINGLHGITESIDYELFVGWMVKVKNLLVTACGETSQHFIAFKEGEARGIMESSYAIKKRLGAIFLAAKEDFEGGYLVSLKHLIQAEVFDSELEQAKDLLASGYKLASAVICGAVLETTLRDLCDSNSIARGKLDAMNGQLAKAGVYSRLQQKRITAIADIRNNAAHGNPDEFSNADVENMIRDVEGFLRSYLEWWKVSEESFLGGAIIESSLWKSSDYSLSDNFILCPCIDGDCEEGWIFRI